MKATRFIELDLWRGLAVVGMVFFHFLFFLSWYEYLNLQLFQDGWLIFARIIQWSFLLLVGISIAVRYQKSKIIHEDFFIFYRFQIKRAVIILFFALLITFVTKFFVPSWFIRFGILHLIAFSILMLPLLAPYPLFALYVSGLLYGAQFFLFSLKTNSIALFIVGIPNPEIHTLDYFPLVPWMGIPLLGLFFGSYFYQEYKSLVPIRGNKFLRPFIWAGKHAFLIYLVHGPLYWIFFSGIDLFLLYSR